MLRLGCSKLMPTQNLSIAAMLEFWVGISLEEKCESSASTVKTRPTILTFFESKRGAHRYTQFCRERAHESDARSTVAEMDRIPTVRVGWTFGLHRCIRKTQALRFRFSYRSLCHSTMFETSTGGSNKNTQSFTFTAA